MKHLSREEMKKVMGGFAPPEGCVAVCCSNGGGGCEGYGSATFYAATCEDASAFCSNSGGSTMSCRCRPGGY